MNRRDFLKTAAILTVVPTSMSMQNFAKLSAPQKIYYGNTPVTAKGVFYSVTKGDLTGGVLASGKDAGIIEGVLTDIPVPGSPGDPVTLTLWWEEGEPIVDRFITARTELS